MSKRIAITLIALLSVAICGSQLVFSQAREKADDYQAAEQIAKQAVEKLKDDDISGMFSFLKGKINGDDKSFGNIESALPMVKEARLASYGNSVHEVEFLHREVVGKSIVCFTYLEKLERQAVIWKFVFYRATTQWHLSGLMWDDKPTTNYQNVK
jgi:hypothetical protein